MIYWCLIWCDVLWSYINVHCGYILLYNITLMLHWWLWICDVLWWWLNVLLSPWCIGMCCGDVCWCVLWTLWWCMLVNQWWCMLVFVVEMYFRVCCCDVCKSMLVCVVVMFIGVWYGDVLMCVVVLYWCVVLMHWFVLWCCIGHCFFGMVVYFG